MDGRPVEPSIIALDEDHHSRGKSWADTKLQYSWTLLIDGAPHRIDFTNSKTSGKKRVFVDGRLLHEQKVYRASAFQFNWPIGGHLLSVVPEDLDKHGVPTSPSSATTRLWDMKDELVHKVDCAFELRIDGKPFHAFPTPSDLRRQEARASQPGSRPPSRPPPRREEEPPDRSLRVASASALGFPSSNFPSNFPSSSTTTSSKNRESSRRKKPKELDGEEKEGFLSVSTTASTEEPSSHAWSNHFPSKTVVQSKSVAPGSFSEASVVQGNVVQGTVVQPTVLQGSVVQPGRSADAPWGRQVEEVFSSSAKEQNPWASRVPDPWSQRLQQQTQQQQQQPSGSSSALADSYPTERKGQRPKSSPKISSAATNVAFPPFASKSSRLSPRELDNPWATTGKTKQEKLQAAQAAASSPPSNALFSAFPEPDSHAATDAFAAFPAFAAPWPSSSSKPASLGTPTDPWAKAALPQDSPPCAAAAPLLSPWSNQMSSPENSPLASSLAISPSVASPVAESPLVRALAKRGNCKTVPTQLLPSELQPVPPLPPLPPPAFPQARGIMLGPDSNVIMGH